MLSINLSFRVFRIRPIPRRLSGRYVIIISRILIMRRQFLRIFRKGFAEGFQRVYAEAVIPDARRARCPLVPIISYGNGTDKPRTGCQDGIPRFFSASFKICRSRRFSSPSVPACFEAIPRVRTEPQSRSVTKVRETAREKPPQIPKNFTQPPFSRQIDRVQYSQHKQIRPIEQKGQGP